MARREHRSLNNFVECILLDVAYNEPNEVMKTLHPSSQYKRDLKRICNNKKKAEALLEILNLLENELPIP